MGSSAGNGDRRDQGRSMTLAGMIAAIRRRPGKGAFIALTDGTSRIELAVFERLFQEASDHLAGDEIIVVRGQAGLADIGGGFKMVANEANGGDRAGEKLRSWG